MNVRLAPTGIVGTAILADATTRGIWRSATFLRPTFFMQNALGQPESIRHGTFRPRWLTRVSVRWFGVLSAVVGSELQTLECREVGVDDDDKVHSAAHEGLGVSFDGPRDVDEDDTVDLPEPCCDVF